jgi:ABC-type nitrate/sulfonate/bicarbonate transport system permease component
MTTSIPTGSALATSTGPAVLPSGATWSSSLGRALRHPRASASVGVGGLVACWAVAATVRPELFPTPAAVVRSFADDRSMIWANAKATARIAALGWVWGNAVAIAIAAVVALVPSLEHAALRMAAIVYCLPALAIGPILQVLLEGDSPKIAISALTVFFMTLVGALVGLRAAPARSLDVVRAAGGATAAELRYVRARAALPHLLAAMRIAGPAAVLGAILGEYLSGATGLGPAMITAQSQLDVARTWALGLTGTALAAIAYGLVAIAGRASSGWMMAADADAVALGEPGYHGGGSLGGRGLSAVAALSASVAAAVVIWWAAIVLFNLDPLVAKRPAEVWTYLVTAAEAATNRSEIFDAMATTLRSAAVGYVAGTLAAVGLVVAFVLWRPIEFIVMPTAVVLQSIPLGVFTPVILIIFGRGLATTAVICGIITFFPTLVMASNAVRNVPRRILDVLHASGATTATVLRKAQLPTAIPALLAAGRVAVPRAIIGALLVEWLASGEGIGYLMLRSTTTFEYTQLWAAVVVCTLTMVVLYAAVTFVESVVLDRLGGQ